MAYDFPAAPPNRGTAIWRWVSFLLVLLLLLLVVYLAAIGFVGSGQLVEPASPSRDCRTPALAYGWTYEVINYAASEDLALENAADLTDCDLPNPVAGSALVSADGVGLAGWYIPAGSQIGESGPTVILVHDYGMNKSSMLETAALLHDDYNLVLFDLRNHGQSDASATTGGLLERLDVRAVVDWLTERKEPSAIGILGVSMGGAAAINAAPADQRVAALALDSTHATLANTVQARIEQQGFPLGLPAAWAVLFGGLIRTGQDMSSADPIQVAERYGDRPLLVIAAGNDALVGRDDADGIATAAREGGSEVDEETCPDAPHDASVEVCPDDYRDWVLGFFGSALQTSP